MSVRAAQCSNAYCPMEDTDPGITTLSREGHSRNAWAPMSEVPSGITMDLRFAAWLNALSSMVPTNKCNFKIKDYLLGCAGIERAYRN